MSIMFPSKIIKAVENFSPMVPIFNTGTIGTNMNKNFNSTVATMNRMRSPTSTIDIESEKQLEKITKRNEELNHGFRHMAARFTDKDFKKNNETGRWEHRAVAIYDEWLNDPAEKPRLKKKAAAAKQFNETARSMGVNVK